MRFDAPHILIRTASLEVASSRFRAPRNDVELVSFFSFCFAQDNKRKNNGNRRHCEATKWPKQPLSYKFLFKSAIAACAFLSCFLCTTANAAFPTGWSRSCAITVQHAQVTADQVDFPILVSYRATSNNETNLPDEMIQTGNQNAAQDNGGDIRFTLDAAGATPLHYEIVLFSKNATLTNAKAEIWVKLPSISASTDTTLYVWYKGPGGSTTPSVDDATWGSQGVWSTDFKGVWHLPDGASLTTNDSTSNINNGILQGTTPPSAVSGRIDGAGTFGGTSATAQVNIANTFWNAQMTMSAWIKCSSCQGILSSGSDGKGIAIAAYGGNLGMVYMGNDWVVTANNISDDKWHYVVLVRDTSIGNETRNKLYIDGNEGAYSYRHALTGSSPTGTSSIGTYFQTSSGSSGQYTNGVIDETRISYAARSADWIKTEYNNQSAPDNFIARGQPATAGTTVAPASVTGLSAVSGVGSVAY